jgi:AcrR family transcriptional regulator
MTGSMSRDSVAARSVERALARRYDAYRDEVQRLIRAGVAVMQRDGSCDPRVSEILQEAGLSNQAFYRHFRSKDELLLAILDDGLGVLLAYLDTCMPRDGAPIDRIRGWIDGVITQALHPRGARATRPFVSQRARLAERFPEQTTVWIRRVQAPLGEAIAAARDAGVLPGADPERDADAVYHLVMGWVERKLLDEVAPSERDAAHVANFAMRGLRGLRDSSAEESRSGA